MKTTTRLMLLAVLALPVLAACNKDEATPPRETSSLAFSAWRWKESSKPSAPGTGSV